ncbi:proline reductase cluster protein PrdD [Paramaledivibacter caminithermalis]|jgi:D-proline reductase (dithiol) PrdD|uniref:D-proline reductase (Dithiol) PrdD n=1 Tax=Paramaledivibacter caminithermalis (strain DSM 15212 / CIP 107654 / DViRD3) TaxID=1121301 RepID=A0A1M6LI30_PARC5|nr:proline reductase cluster protein PrdD [Paramaledivibacter caminithermalis]SHJ70844.1 D-proline reductase (dithiol) PrdD [Paramaledivibacter caminithermalis DSM 15212]
MKDTILRRLVIKSFHIEQVMFGKKTTIHENTLTIDKKEIPLLEESEELVKSIQIDILKPGEYHKYTNTIMDIIPISAKVLGEIGEGITHTLTGVYVMLTGVDEDGRQMSEFGSSEGFLDEQMVFDRAGTPSIKDYIIHFDVTLKGGLPFSRELTLATHRVCDRFIQNLRNILKNMDGRKCSEANEYYDRIRSGKKNVLIIKQIAGQGANYDNQILPSEPSGFSGGRSIIDMGNIPIILSPNEYRDGAIRAMT